MTQAAWTRDGIPVDASNIPVYDWEYWKQSSKLGDFVMPCCRAPAVLKTSINGLQFFAHHSNECATAPETKWHLAGKASVLAALINLGISGQEEFPGSSPRGDRWEADVLFAIPGRTIAIELQRSYQHLRDYLRRQAIYKASGVECYWLVRREMFGALQKSATQILLKRDFNGAWPSGGIGLGMLPELPAAILDADNEHQVIFGMFKTATMQQYLDGIIMGRYQYSTGVWNLG